MPTPSTLFAVNGPVATLTFNRAEARNALTWEMYDALVEACDRVDASAEVRVFVIRGSGGSFAAGTDIAQFTTLSTAEDAIGYERRLDTIIDRLERVAIATIAQVEGVAAGGGCAIALACDLRVCTPAARFGIPIARTLGNCLSATNCARFVEVVGAAHVKDLMFTGRLVDAAEAASLGLVTRLAEPDTVETVVAELAKTIAGNAPLTVRATKEALRRIQRSQRPAQGAADDLVVACYTSEDFRNAVASFLARRPAVFSGR